MVAIAYSMGANGWSAKRAVLLGVVVIAVVAAAQNLRAVLGGAFAAITVRFAIVALFLPLAHMLVVLLLAMSAGTVAWLLVRDLR